MQYTECMSHAFNVMCFKQYCFGERNMICFMFKILMFKSI